MELTKILHHKQMQELQREHRVRMAADAMFEEWRDRYVSNLCGYMRTYREAKERGLKIPNPYRSLDWCNAAIHLLMIPDTEIQDYFLRADPALKDELVSAVIRDRGVCNLEGHFVELPAL